jgi:hypothetical protein
MAHTSSYNLGHSLVVVVTPLDLAIYDPLEPRYLSPQMEWWTDLAETRPAAQTALEL